MRKNTTAADRAGRNRTLRLVCIGASAGGLAALNEIVAAFPLDFAGHVLIVVHTSQTSTLPEILSRRSRLAVAFALDGEPMLPGRVLVAPPGYHLLIDDHHVVLSRGPRQNNFRLAIDPLFKAAARTFGRNAIGVILSGALDDGSAGLAELKRAGGVAIVQDPDEAAFADMPRHALAAVKADYVLKANQIGAQLNRLIAAARPGDHSVHSPTARARAEHIVEEGETDPQVRPPGKISTLTCPECGGTLWEKREGKVLRFLCHTGHGFSTQSLSHAQEESVESALWAALRVLKERAILVAKLAAGERHSRHSRYRAEELGLKLRIEALRKVLLSRSRPYTTAAESKLEK